MQNMRRPITIKYMKSVIKNLQTMKSPGLNGLIGEFYQTFKEELITTVL